MTTNIETIIDTLSTAIESIIPDGRGTPFKRYRGSGKVENAATHIRERAFQFRLGASKTPRTLSSPTVQWQRNELLLVVGYNFDEPRQNDTVGYGIHQLVFSDQKQLVNKLFISNSLSGVSNVLRLQYSGAEGPGDKARVYRFDIEFGETFTS